MKLNSPVAGSLIDFDPFSVRTVADPSMDFGAYLELNDRRAFRYTKNSSAAASSKGKLSLAPAPKANHVNLAVVAAVASNANTVSVTLGATSVVANEYDFGSLHINAGPGAGQDFQISRTPIAAASAAASFTLLDPIDVALTTASRVTLAHSAYNNSLEGTDPTRRASGVGLQDCPAGGFVWLQTKGISATLAQGAIGIGLNAVASGSVSGAVRAVDTTSAATAAAQAPVARATVVPAVDTEYRPVVLTIDL